MILKRNVGLGQWVTDVLHLPPVRDPTLDLPTAAEGVMAPRSQWRRQAAGGVLARRMCSEGVHLVVHSSCGSNVAGL